VHRITYEQLDEKGDVVRKAVWTAPDDGSVCFEERCPVQHIYEVGYIVPYGTRRGPLTLHLTATLDPHVRFVPYTEETAADGPRRGA
jgi:hypothetical protein